MKKVGVITQGVINLLGVPLTPGTPIYIGQSNIDHIKSGHLDDYNKYGDKIAVILESPDYIAKHPKKDSIEYIKVFHVNGEHVLVAARATTTGVFYVRTLFVMTADKVNKYQKYGALKPYQS